MNKKKIVNDPVYGFITIPDELIFDLIQHPWFQRLRRIQQLGLSNLVYPSAVHTRFQHTLGAVHLMGLALEVLRSKGIDITDEEKQAASIAILLHDIGHGPFSHALENILVPLHHEQVSDLMMKALCHSVDDRIRLALEIFNDQHPKRYLHQLVSGQLDVDRLDYLNRDSFFTGVAEGVIGYDRIIKMLNVKDGLLAIEEKGIYSIEKFIISRRLMYWQVYLHKTVVSAEQMLIQIIRRAKELAQSGESLFATPALQYFLMRSELDLSERSAWLPHFVLLDDSDVYSAIKVWQSHPDTTLSLLCRHLMNRILFKVEFQKSMFTPSQKEEKRKRVSQNLFNHKEAIPNYFLLENSTSNSAYSKQTGPIWILLKSGELRDIAEASDQLNISVLSEPVIKHVMCWLDQPL
ncbi:phosphohydrolase [Bacteroidota bacterium]|nr:phosphohydrolase [Bacteroidota bacterium]